MITKYRIIKNYEELDRLIDLCHKVGIACVDFETSGEKIHNKDFKPTILSVTCQPGFGCSIPLWHPETKGYTDIGWSPRRVLRRFSKRVIENRQICKVAWNAKFDFAIFQLFGYFYRGTLLDGMLAKYLLNEEKPNDLKAMVTRYIPEAAGYEADKGFDKIPWDRKPLEQLCQYGCQDTDYTLRLMIFFEKKLFSTGLYSLYRNMIMAASRVLQTVEFNGLYMDRALNQKLLAEYEPKIQQALETCLNLPKVQKFKRWFNEQKVEKYIESIEKELEELNPNDPKDKREIASREQKIANIRAGIFTNKKERELVRDINLNSPVDLPALMFSKEGFNMKPIKQTDSGRPSTDEESLVELRLKVKNPESPKAIFLDSLLELRGLEKMYKTYILGWSEKVQDDDCLHGRFQIQGCVTGNTKLICKEKDITIKDICPKEKGIKCVEGQNIWILSHEGTWEQVTHTINKGKLPTYKVTTSTGDILRCTEHHKVLTTRGWKTVKQAYKHKLKIIMYDTTKFDIEKPIVGRSSNEVIFKEVEGWPGYLVTNEGKVYSVKIPGGRGLLDYNHPHEMVPRYVKGRPRIYLRNNMGKKTAFSISHLVWLTFNNQISVPNGMVIDHINGNPMDNRVENLQCISASENIKRAYTMTRSAYTNGSTNGTTKFDTLTIGKMLEDYSLGLTQGEICKKYNISQKQVSGITLKQRRKEIYLSNIISLEFIGNKDIYDLSVNDKHSYITRSNFINSNTTSGRLSSAEPNMQQVPKTSVDPNIKKQLIARPGKLYLAMDFSQAELRIMAHLSGDETYLKAFAEGQDPHLAIAAKKYGVSYEEANKIYEDENHPDYKLWKTRRKQAKQIAFGIIYGIQAKLLSQKLSDPKAGLIVTPEEAQHQLDEFFKEHPKIKCFMQKQEKVLRKQGYIQSLFGRKRRLPQVYSEDKSEAAYAVRLSVNMPCQSAASDMCLFGSILLYWEQAQGRFPKMTPVCLVHDALYENCSPEDINIWTVYHMWDIFRNPDTKKYFGFRIDDVDMSMDFEIGRTMAEELKFIPNYDYRKMLEPGFSVEEYMEEYKKYKHIAIEDFPKVFPKEFKDYERKYRK